MDANRKDSPWYPSMRIFRQSRPGDWDDPLRRVAGELQQWAKGLSLEAVATAGVELVQAAQRAELCYREPPALAWTRAANLSTLTIAR